MLMNQCLVSQHRALIGTQNPLKNCNLTSNNRVFCVISGENGLDSRSQFTDKLEAGWPQKDLNCPAIWLTATGLLK